MSIGQDQRGIPYIHCMIYLLLIGVARLRNVGRTMLSASPPSGTVSSPVLSLLPPLPPSWLKS